MTSNSVEPAIVAAVNGLEEVDRLAGLITFKRRLFSRARTRRTRWIVVRRRRDASRRIAVYVRTPSFSGVQSMEVSREASH